MNKKEYRILVVDDEEMMRELIVENLSLRGHKVESASSGEEAIRILKESSFHLFIIDIKMTGMSGLELLEKLDIKNNLYEAIIITAYADLDSARAAMELGAFSYITKPFDNKDLRNRANKALEMVALKKMKLDYTKEIEKEVKIKTKELRGEISKHKKAEEALQNADRNWRDSFNSLEDVMLIIDKDYNIENINKNGLKLLGKKREEIIGKKCYQTIHGEKKPRKFCPFKLTLKTKKASSVERYVNKLGKHFSINTSPIFNEKGEIIEFVDLMRDITEPKKAEEELKNSQKQLRDLTAHLQSVREQERTSIAREIHDELGQVLTALKMDLSWLNKRLPEDQKELSKKTESMNKLIDSTIKTVQKISTELRPDLLDDLGLTAAIEWQAGEFSNRTGTKCKVSADFEEDILNDDSKIIIFRIFQETLTNVGRHAEATKVKVNLREKKRELVLKVSDNGKGIEEEHISDLESFGLIGIKERARFLGGEVMIEGIEGKGTTVIVSIPLNKEAVRVKQ